jgi:hypothetical protein
MIVLGASLCAHAYATDLADAIKGPPAQIEVVNMKPQPLVAGGSDKKGWAKVPAELTKSGAVVYMPGGNTNGTADIKVTGDGCLLVACNYDYQGNQQGNWQKEVWDERKFKSKGWHVSSKTELGGELISGSNLTQVLFIKQVRKGDTLVLRCNKYNPPYPILLPAK